MWQAGASAESQPGDWALSLFAPADPFGDAAGGLFPGGSGLPTAAAMAHSDRPVQRGVGNPLMPTQQAAAAPSVLPRFPTGDPDWALWGGPAPATAAPGPHVFLRQQMQQQRLPGLIPTQANNGKLPQHMTSPPSATIARVHGSPFTAASHQQPPAAVGSLQPPRPPAQAKAPAAKAKQKERSSRPVIREAPAAAAAAQQQQQQQRAAEHQARVAAMLSLIAPSSEPYVQLEHQAPPAAAGGAGEEGDAMLRQALCCLQAGPQSEVNWALNALTIASYHPLPAGAGGGGGGGGGHMLLSAAPAGLADALWGIVLKGVDVHRLVAPLACYQVDECSGQLVPCPSDASPSWPPAAHAEAPAALPARLQAAWWQQEGLLSETEEEVAALTAAVCASNVLRNLSITPANAAHMASSSRSAECAVQALHFAAAQPCPSHYELASNILDVLIGLAPSLSGAQIHQAVDTAPGGGSSNGSSGGSASASMANGTSGRGSGGDSGRLPAAKHGGPRGCNSVGGTGGAGMQSSLLGMLQRLLVGLDTPLRIQAQALGVLGALLRSGQPGVGPGVQPFVMDPSQQVVDSAVRLLGCNDEAALRAAEAEAAGALNGLDLMLGCREGDATPQQLALLALRLQVESALAALELCEALVAASPASAARQALQALAANRALVFYLVRTACQQWPPAVAAQCYAPQGPAQGSVNPVMAYCAGLAQRLCAGAVRLVEQMAQSAALRPCLAAHEPALAAKAMASSAHAGSYARILSCLQPSP